MTIFKYMSSLFLAIIVYFIEGLWILMEHSHKKYGILGIKDFEIITYKRNDYLSILNELVENQVSGGSSYDSLIAYSIEKTKVDKILTLNSKDFIRVKPEAANIIAEP